MAYSLSEFIVNTAKFHLKGNLAVLLGVVIATASLTGALLVGDSLRGSLADIVKSKLMWVNEAVLAQRFFNEKIVPQLQEKSAVPAIVLKAALQVRDEQDCLVTQISNAQVVAVTKEFWQGDEKADLWKETKGVWLNNEAASKLQLMENTNVVLRIEKPSAIPRESFLGSRDDVVDSFLFKVEKILSPTDKFAGFNLFSGMEVPATIFIPIELLQEKLGVPARVNAILSAKTGLQEKFRSLLALSDYELTLKGPEEKTTEIFSKLDRDNNKILDKREYQGKIPSKQVSFLQQENSEEINVNSVRNFYRSYRNYYSLESSQMLVAPFLADKAISLAKEMGLEPSQLMVYLANNIEGGNNSIPYSIVAGIDLALQKRLGVVANLNPIAGNNLWLLNWVDSPITLEVGKEINLNFFLPEVVGRPIEKKESFWLRGFVSSDLKVIDPDITPAFPGITDKLSLDSWNPPFPYDNKKIKPKDEKYWQDYRTTPKAFIDLDVAQKLWGSRFGKITSVRIFPMGDSFPVNFADDFSTRLLKEIDPASYGFVFQDLRARFQQSSQSGTDFSGLFVGFSFFLILSALILVSLLFRLHIERRSTQVGTILALGANQKQVANLLLAEGALVAFVGTIIGLIVACFYGFLLVYYLKANWPDNSLQQILKLHIPIKTLLLGLFLALLMSVLAIFRTAKTLVKAEVINLVKGGFLDSTSAALKNPTTLVFCGMGFLIAGFGLLFLPSSEDHELKALKFFGAGGFALTAGLFFLGSFLRFVRNIMVVGKGLKGLIRFSIRNMARNKTRSLLTAGLLSSAAFLIIAVEPFRKEAEENQSKDSGTGGFKFVVETNIPVLSGLDGQSGIDSILDGVQKSNRGNPLRAKQQVERFRKVLQDIKIYSLRFYPGDDASCLNLFQPSRPRVLGVPKDLQQRGGFKFAATTEVVANPWQLLNLRNSSVNAFGEKNTVEWMIHSGLGKDYKMQDGAGRDETLRFSGLLQGSVFQSEILIDESQFLKLFPQQQGYQYFLVDSDQSQLLELEEALKIGLSEYGAKVNKTKDLVERFAAVENAYLSMFQGLGSIGLLIGTMGVAAVLARSIWERRSEIGLLSAIGFTYGDVILVMLMEHALLLFLGLGIGTLAALVSVIPLEHSTSMRWGVLALLQVGMFFFGVMVCVASLWSVRTENFVSAMRKE